LDVAVPGLSRHVRVRVVDDPPSDVLLDSVSTPRRDYMRRHRAKLRMLEGSTRNGSSDARRRIAQDLGLREDDKRNDAVADDEQRRSAWFVRVQVLDDDVEQRPSKLPDWWSSSEEEDVLGANGTEIKRDQVGFMRIFAVGAWHRRRNVES